MIFWQTLFFLFFWSINSIILVLTVVFFGKCSVAPFGDFFTWEAESEQALGGTKAGSAPNHCLVDAKRMNSGEYDQYPPVN